MAHPVTSIHVEHHPVAHRIEPCEETEPRPLTLLELVEAVAEIAEDEQELLATVTWMLRSGRIQLVGTFRDAPVDQLFA